MAFSSPNNPKALPPAKDARGTDLVNEEIDERILRLLGLDDVFDIDFDTYKTLLRERLVAARMTSSKIPAEEDQLIQEEFKRVKRKTGRFKVTKKKITAEDFKKGSATGLNIARKSIGGIASPRALLPAAKDIEEKSPLQEIIGALADIIKILNEQNRFQKNLLDKSRRGRESLGRELSESNLEKGFKAATKVSEKVLAPVKSLLQRILDFFLTLLVGRVVYKLIEWFGDKENQRKVQSIIRFLGDHWPKLLALYLRFGTGLGRFVGTLSKLLIKGAIRLGAIAANLIGAKGVGKFLGGKGGRMLGAGLQVATTVGTTMALSSGIENFGGIGGEQKTPGFAGGGMVKVPAFAGGGLNFKGLMGKASPAMFGPLGMLMSGLMGSNSSEPSGYVSGEKGVDKVPAMLSDGEFVMSRGAVQKYGVDTLESMNAAGGGTNRPRMISGTTYAAGGGYIGSQEEKKERVKDPILQKRQKDFGPGATPQISTQEDFEKFRKLADAEKFAERLKRIEAQIQSQRGLSSGKGINIKGSELGTNIGKGFSTTFMGREAIKVSLPPGGSYENEITLAGKRYFAMKKGNDIIYVSHFAKGLSGQVDKYGARNESYKNSAGGGLVGGYGLKRDNKNLPKTKIMTGPDGPYVGYLRIRNGQPEYARPTQRKSGFLEQLANLFDPKSAAGRQETLNARSMRLAAITDLEQYRKEGMKEENIKKMLGPNLYSKAVNDLKAKKARIKQESDMKSQAGMAKYSASSVSAAQRVSQGKYYGPGGDPKGTGRGQVQLAKSKPNLKAPAPPSKPPVVVRSTAGGGQGGRRGSGSSPSTRRTTVPSFGAVCKAKDRPRNAKILGIF